MPKRGRDEDEGEKSTPSKRTRLYYSTDRLSTLSDELALRILSFLPVSALLKCQSLSYRFQTLAGDSEIWKEKYYARFVRPRAIRIPGIKDTQSSDALLYSSKLSKWLDEDHLVRRGRDTNWKAQYRLRHNWSKGSCHVKELEVAQPPVPSALVKYHRGLIVTLNPKHDLRVWRAKDGPFLGEIRSAEYQSQPTSLAIDNGSTSSERMALAIGYEDGSFGFFDMNLGAAKFVQRYKHAPSSNGSITSIASSFPYLLTMSQSKTLSLYRFDYENTEIPTKFKDPKLLSSLTANQAYAPVTVSIRTSSLGVIACIAYCYSRLRLGWNIGLQEILLTDNGEETESRIAWAPDWLERNTSVLYDSDVGTMLSRRAVVRTRPSSLSYSHPYLLASYPDNTLKVYQVASTAARLTIHGGRRLWGHTSGVSGAEISDRGKAVSVSCQGDDIRIWELEETLRSSSANTKPSVRVIPALRSQDNERHQWSIGISKDAAGGALCGGWIAFDEEQVVVLNDRSGTQYISCYDFT